MLEDYVIIRPCELEIIDVYIEFNQTKYEKLEIDLKHVNKLGRSAFSGNDINEIITYFLNGLNLSPSAEKVFFNEICSYYIRIDMWKMKRIKIVFCICSDRPLTIGVITLFRVK